MTPVPVGRPLVGRVQATDELGANLSGRLVAVVGPCASGKTRLVRALRNRRYDAREVAQEHSLVADLWRRVTRPDFLVYLDVSPGVASQRRTLSSPDRWWPKLASRLRLARQEADLYILTDDLTPQQVLDQTLGFLETTGSTDLEFGP